MRGVEDAARLVADRLADRLPGKVDEMRARYGATVDVLPDVVTVDAFDRQRLPVEAWPAVLVVGQETRGMAPARVTGAGETFEVRYALRVYVWARAGDEAATDTARKRYALAVRELLIGGRVIDVDGDGRPAGWADPLSLVESYSDLAVDDSGATVAGAYVGVDVILVESVPGDPVGEVATVNVDTAALPPHPAL